MSQPLSNRQGGRIPLQASGERGPKLSTETTIEPVGSQRVVPMRDMLVLIFLLVALVCLPVGVAMIAGTGGALITVGALALILGAAIQYG